MPAAVRERILAACYQFLQPIARFLLRSGISYREFEVAVKRAFVSVAAVDYGLRGRPTNISRISAMTGIPRKEVRRWRNSMEDSPVQPWVRLGPPGDLLHGWFTDAQFQDESGRALPLPYDEGNESFCELARRYAGDIPPGALRSELERLGIIEETTDGRLRPLQRHVVPSEFDEKLLTSLSFNLYALATTIAHNSNPTRHGPGHIERFVNNECIPISERPEVRAELRRRIQAFSEEIDDFLAAKEDLSQRSDRSVGMGVYYYEKEPSGD